jgi:hypothetical protein
LSEIVWTNERRKLADLLPWPRNPRQIREAEAERLAESVETFGQVETLAIGPGNEVYNGHQRLNVLMAKHGPDYEVDVRVSSRALTEKEREKLTVYLHRGAAGSWDFDILANEFDVGELLDWGFEDWELGIGDSPEEDPHQITRSGRLYNAGDGHEIEPFKLAYRVEAAYRAEGNLALDLYSGEGQLASWYRRRFKRVVTVDKAYAVGDVDYSMPAEKFIRDILPEYIDDFDFVDFDDEGCPAKEIATFFEVLRGRRKRDFVLALTDGQGLNLQLRGYFDPGTYLMPSEGMRRATREDYDAFEDMVTAFVERVAEGWAPELISSYCGRKGHVVFQTWLMRHSNEA